MEDVTINLSSIKSKSSTLRQIINCHKWRRTLERSMSSDPSHARDPWQAWRLLSHQTERQCDDTFKVSKAESTKNSLSSRTSVQTRRRNEGVPILNIKQKKQTKKNQRERVTSKPARQVTLRGSPSGWHERAISKLKSTGRIKGHG